MKKTINTTIILAFTLFATAAQAGFLGNLVRPDRPRPVEPPPRYPGPVDRPGQIVFFSAGEVQTNKLVSNTFTFAPPQWDERIYRIQLTGTEASVRIQSAQVAFLDGSIRDLHELVGTLQNGRRIGAFIEARQVREVRIAATSDSLIGSRGKFLLEFGVLR